MLTFIRAYMQIHTNRPLTYLIYGTDMQTYMCMHITPIRKNIHTYIHVYVHTFMQKHNINTFMQKNDIGKELEKTSALF